MITTPMLVYGWIYFFPVRALIITAVALFVILQICVIANEIRDPAARRRWGT